jgi:hypothetical protein
MRVPQRGRAILRRLSAHDSVRAFRPGDFLLTKSGAGMARLTGIATGSELNHAAIIIDPTGTIIEANPSFMSDARAFRLSSISEYLNAGKPCWIGYVELREGTRQEVVAYAEHMLRARGLVTLMGRLWLALHALTTLAPLAWTSRFLGLRALYAFFDRHALVMREEHCISGAEFVARALERGGFIWDRDPAHITPAELFLRYHHADTPVVLSATQQARIRRGVGAIRVAEHEGEGAPITRLAPRGIQGATALNEQLDRDEEHEAGMRTLVKLGVFMAAGLAVVGVIEEIVRAVNLEA